MHYDASQEGTFYISSVMLRRLTNFLYQTPEVIIVSAVQGIPRFLWNNSLPLVSRLRHVYPFHIL
jgi:hypothetical protein